MTGDGMGKVRRRCSEHGIELTAGVCDECAKLMPVRSSVSVFEDGDDAGYREWVRLHQGGYVLNVQRTLNTSDAMLHQASCHTINDAPASGGVFVGESYVKACALRRDELERWASANLEQSERIQECQQSCCFG